MMTSPNEHISALLILYAGNSSVTGEFPSQRQVTRSLDVFLVKNSAAFAWKLCSDCIRQRQVVPGRVSPNPATGGIYHIIYCPATNKTLQHQHNVINDSLARSD